MAYFLYNQYHQFFGEVSGEKASSHFQAFANLIKYVHNGNNIQDEMRINDLLGDEKT